MAKKKKKSSFRTEQRFDPIFHSSERGERGISLFFVPSRCGGSIDESRLNEPLPPSLVVGANGARPDSEKLGARNRKG